MNRRLRLLCHLFFVLIAVVCYTKAQNVAISWSAFNSGFERSTGTRLVLISATGQVAVGRSIDGNTMIESGFLASGMLRGPITGITERPLSNLPKEFGLLQNYPNPFNPSTTIRYQLPMQTHVTLRLYDVLGREVATLMDQRQDAGYKTIQWSAGELPSGVYFYRLAARDFVATKKLMLLK